MKILVGMDLRKKREKRHLPHYWPVDPLSMLCANQQPPYLYFQVTTPGGAECTSTECSLSTLTSQHSGDHTGRCWWVVGGLCCSAAGLLTAACGAGFQGQLLLGVPTAPAALAAGDAEQH
eukprot:scaffold134511_cov26-Tisochrysis_lutea.AAC.1